MDFFGRLIRPLGGTAPSNFLHALEIDQALLAHTPIVMGVLKKF